MRRTASPLSLVSVGLGTFLLVLAGLLAWYVEPRAERTTLDIDTSTVFTGTGSYFDTAKIRTVQDQRITITRQVRGDVAESERSGRAVWDAVTSVDTDKTLPASDPHDALQWTLERWVTDRRTNAPVHCCGEQPAFQGEAYLKFPFHVQKRTYTWWDNTLGATVPLRFSGVTKVQGYEGYRFTGTVAPARTGSRLVPGRIVGLPKKGQVLAEEWYANHGIELVADPTTGRILYAAIGPRKTLRAPGSAKDAAVLLDSEKIAFTPATQRQQVGFARDDNDRLTLLGTTLPLVAGALGALLVVAGAVFVVRGRGGRTAAEGPEGPGSPGGPDPDTSPTTLETSTM
ncbi:DUF3068 domain-containing protein [Streptomyces sp. VRA16 Mangrove soil]|uniref:DUF3068 domain-containing protein n=1 Tax=Streptomyces sp. VRA16 Mangrove soil TaxID=2817434 RepID=UPI001A9DB511|nr:DUF3068 domain-containing protein [Streptomyces sp. VRA16 Mangrove soil]MBO1336846.1 DUF3068 domain-containing protein [Streptomyces sp. VRA16 Mangrove soil]